MRVNENGKTFGLVGPAIAFAVCVLTRLPFTSKLLFNMDSVQFALALDRFDVAVHQPQPPGYYLYVLMGRLTRLAIPDENTALVSVSILFSGLTAALGYALARRVFGETAGVVSAALLITSPLFWQHGEVALSYMPEAFMSLLSAWLCYRVLRGEHHLFWVSAIAMAVAGGVRQNTMVFLMPLWLYSMKDIGIRRMVAGLLIMGATVLVWALPMLAETGGYARYSAALDAHWNDANWRGIHLHWIIFNARYMAYFIVSGLLVAAVPLTEFVVRGLSGRTGWSLERRDSMFFALWVLPPFLFHLIIFTHPAVPGHTLIYMTGVIILSARSIQYVGSRVAEKPASVSAARATAVVAGISAAVNALFFLATPFQLSYASIREHDRLLSRYMETIREDFSPDDTEIIGSDRFFFSYRHAMYYLPEFTVFDTVLLTTPDGPRTLWGRHRDTSRAPIIRLDKGTRRVVDFMNYGLKDKASLPAEARTIKVGDDALLVYYDDLDALGKVKRIAPLLPHPEPAR